MHESCRSSAPSRSVQVSVLIPAKDEADSISPLACEIEEVMDDTGAAWECIWVDDGSTDATLEMLRRLHRRRSEHRYISLDRNYGQSGALAAGFEAVRGGIIVTLDADLQNDPRDIPRLLAALADGPAAMVNAVRARRRDSLVRRISSVIANGFRNWVTHERVTDVGCSLRAFRAECVRGIPVFRGMHRFLPTLVRMRGYGIAEVAVGHRPRRFGATKYGIHNRLWVGIADTFGMRWLQARGVMPVVKLSSQGEDAAGGREALGAEPYAGKDTGPGRGSRGPAVSAVASATPGGAAAASGERDLP